VLAEYDPRVVPHLEELTPSPQSKIVTVPFSGLLKLLRRLPIIFATKLLFIGYSLAVAQERANLGNVFALYC
jgi:hypothetical protein